jgi:hypothetical protein
MRVTDEQIKLLRCHGQHGTQHFDQGGGCQGPSVARKAARVCTGKVFSAHAYSGVAAKVSGVLCGLHGSGNGNLCIRGICVIAQELAPSDMRIIPRLDLGQHVPLAADEPAASR